MTEAEKRKAELEAILSKPANRKSILKGQKVDSPAPVKKEPEVKTPAKGQVKTPAKKSNVPAVVEPTPAVEKTPVKGQGKTPNKNATNTPTTVKQEAVEDAKKKTPAKGPATPVQNAKSPATGKQGAVEEAKAADKTPTKAVKVEKTPVAKTPTAGAVAPSPKAGATPSKGSQQSPTTPKRMKASDFFELEAEDELIKKRKVKGTPTSAPAKGTPAKETPAKTTPAKQAKKAAQTLEQKVKSPASTTQAVDSPAPSVDAKAPESKKVVSKEDKKAKQKAKKAAKKAAKQAEATTQVANNKKTKPDSKALKEVTEKVKRKAMEGDSTWYPNETQFIAQANEARFLAIREKLVAAGKTEEQIKEELPRVWQTNVLQVRTCSNILSSFWQIQKSMLKRLSHTRCLRCRKRGHMQKDCPQSRAPVKCYKCGDNSHTAKAYV